MWIVLAKFFLLILLTSRCQSEADKGCSPSFFDCENGKCIHEIWTCDGENDCGNFKDEENCGANSVLFYSTLKEVLGIRLKSNEYFSVVQAVNVASALDFNPRSNRVYWIDVSNMSSSSVYSVEMNGGSRQTVLSHGLVIPEDIAVDYIADNLYITDSGLRQVLVCNLDGRMCHVLHDNVEKPRSIVLDLDSRLMYWSDWGKHSPGIYRSGMDGSMRISMVSERIAWPNGIALDHTTNRLYWVDAKLGTIEFIALDGTLRKVLSNTAVSHPYSLAVFEDTIYWSDWGMFTLESCNKFTGHKATLLGRQSGRKLMGVHVYDPVLTSNASNPCSYNDCSHMCLMSPEKGFRCACPHGFKLSTDDKTCISICSGDDFQCKNGRCVLKSWRCDNRDDCGDNSDEEECPKSSTTCENTHMTCLNGECVPLIWRCDGTADCTDGSDELKCNETLCNVKDHVRCDNGQCITIAWVCDGMRDCLDGSDEKNCSKSTPCPFGNFQCESDGSCIDKILRCDRRVHCVDASDEKNCPNARSDCKSDMFSCKDGTCINKDEVCDGHNDCENNEDEMNCTRRACEADEWPCQEKCISLRWFCDGDQDCEDGSDENNCYGATTSSPMLPPAPACDGFYCLTTNNCLPWSSVCDGYQDCIFPSDEGGLCSKSCSIGNGCSHTCQKTPNGSKCFCNEGYGLLPDNKTCDDINECDEVGTCSHFCNNTRGGFKCSCAEGYMLHNDNRFCKAEGGSAKLLYLLKHQIRGFDLGYRLLDVYLNMEDVEMVCMDYDAAEEIFYWTDKNGSINAYSEKSQQKEFTSSLPSTPTTLKYDWIAKNLYYLDRTSSIGVCTKDVKNCKTLFPPNTDNLVSMTIAPTFGLMFWTVWADNLRNRNSGAVVRAEMDGSKRLPIVQSELVRPTGITVDHILQMIYWSDLEMNTLECADFNGFKRRLVMTSGAFRPVAVAVFEDDIYWTDWGADSIMRCNKFIEGKCARIKDNNVKTRVLLAAHEALQPKVPNKCLNMSCQHMCVLTRGDPVCLCKDGFEGNKTCELSLTETTTTSLSSSNSSISTLSTHSSTEEPQCPEDYCPGGEKCIVVNGEFICKSCELGMHKCNDGTCVNNYQICDGKEDCSSKEDEMNCFRIENSIE